MATIAKYFTLSLLLLCYTLTFHVMPVMHTHSIPVTEIQSLKEQADSRNSSADDMLVCLICQRITTLHVISISLDYFSLLLPTEQQTFCELRPALVSLDHPVADSRGPPSHLS